MPYIQQVPKQSTDNSSVQHFTLNDFSGGFNNREILLKSNEASDMRNMIYYDMNILEKRRGSKLWDSRNLQTGELMYIDRFRPYTASDMTIRATNSSLGFDDGVTQTTYTLNGETIDGENFQGKYFYCDGSKLYVYGNFYAMGSNTFTRVVGTPSLNNQIMTVVSTPADYTPLEKTYKKGVTVYDFNQSKVWYEPCLNEKLDPYKGVSVIPQNPRFICSFNGRLYVSGNKRDNDNVFLTDVGNPFYFPPTLPIQMPPNSDQVMGLVVYDNAVVVGRKEDVHVIEGQTNDPTLNATMFSLRKLNTHTGFISNKCASMAQNYMFYVGFDGNCYALSSVHTDSKTLVTTVLNKTVDLTSAPFGFSHDDIATACCHYQDNLWYVSIKDFVLVYDMRNGAWCVWDNLHIRSFFNLDGTLIWGNASGDICTPSIDYLDQNHPYQAKWTSGYIDFGSPVYYKQFRDFWFVTNTFAGYTSTIDVLLEMDYSDGHYVASVNSQQAIWGTSKFGDKFVRKSINASQPFTVGLRARTMKLTYSNGYNQKGTFINYSDLYTLQTKLDGDMYYITNDDLYYVYDSSTDAWTSYKTSNLSQPMRIYQVIGQYYMKGER